MTLKETGFNKDGIIDRNNLSDIEGETIASTYTDSKGWIVFVNTKGEAIMMVRYENIFDPSGNRFAESA